MTIPTYSRTEGWERDPIALIMDGIRYETERYVVRIDDWRATPFGPINMGYVSIGPARWLPHYPVLKETKRPWWKFWN